MPITVACPACAARLTAPDSTAGKRVKCPKCQTLMLIPANDAGDGDDFEILEDAPKPVKTPVRKPAARLPDDDEVDRPRRRRYEDDDDEDDERPRRRNRYEDEDDEEPEEERPRKKSARKGKKKKAKSGVSPALIAAISLGGLFLLGGLAAAVYFFAMSDADPVANRNTGAPGLPGVPGVPPPPGEGSAPAEPQPPPPLPPGWQRFEPPGKGVSVAVPIQLLPFNLPVKPPDGTYNIWQAQNLQTQKLYQVLVIRPDQAKPPGDAPDKFYHELFAGFAQAAGLGTAQNVRPILVSGRTGRQAEFQGSQKAIMQVVIGNNNIYVFTVAGPGAITDSDPDVSDFFNSIQISG